MGIYILSAVIIIILLFCWLRYGRDKVKPVITVETMPPDGLDPMP